MNIVIKEIRRNTGMTQREFADMYGIPLSTLRKWEQGESSPPGYVVDLIAKALPGSTPSLIEVQGRDGAVFYYDKWKKQVQDRNGNHITINEDLEGVKKQNLGLYLTELFDSFYEIRSKFERDCHYDKQEDIIWV